MVVPSFSCHVGSYVVFFFPVFPTLSHESSAQSFSMEQTSSQFLWTQFWSAAIWHQPRKCINLDLKITDPPNLNGSTQKKAACWWWDSQLRKVVVVLDDQTLPSLWFLQEMELMLNNNWEEKAKLSEASRVKLGCMGDRGGDFVHPHMASLWLNYGFCIMFGHLWLRKTWDGPSAGAWAADAALSRRALTCSTCSGGRKAKTLAAVAREDPGRKTVGFTPEFTNNGDLLDAIFI